MSNRERGKSTAGASKAGGPISKTQGLVPGQDPPKTRFGAPPAENVDYVERKFQRFGQPVSGKSVPKGKQDSQQGHQHVGKKDDQVTANSRLPPQNVKPMNAQRDSKLPPKPAQSGQKAPTTLPQVSRDQSSTSDDNSRSKTQIIQDFAADDESEDRLLVKDASGAGRLAGREAGREDREPAEKVRGKEMVKKTGKTGVSAGGGVGGPTGQIGKSGSKTAAKDDVSVTSGATAGSSINQAHQALDYSEIHKLLDRMKRLSDSNAKLTVEVAQLQQRIELYEKVHSPEQSEPEAQSPTQPHWSHLRDKILKTELLQLRLETHRLRSSSRLNDRFGDLLALHSRESESLVTRCLSLLNEEEGNTSSSKKANSLLLDVVSCLMKHNSAVQGTKRDFDILQAELGAGNRREWDGDFGQSEIHSATKLVTSVEQVLLDHEGNLSDIISRIESSRLDSEEEVSLLKEALLSQVNALVKKSFLIGSFIFDKKSVQELTKKLKPLQDTSLRSSLLVLEERLRENIENMNNCTDSQIQQLVAHQAKSIADKAYSDQSMASLNKVAAMMTFIEYQLKMVKCEGTYAQIVHRNEYFLRDAAFSLYSPTTQLLNFLDRNVYNMQSEVYIQLRNTILQNWDKYLAGEALKPQHMIYLQGLINDTKQLLLKNQPRPDDPGPRQSRPPAPRRHAPTEDWRDKDSGPPIQPESPRDSDFP